MESVDEVKGYNFWNTILLLFITGQFVANSREWDGMLFETV